MAERLGPDRLAALLRRGAHLTPAQLVDAALEAIDAPLRRLRGQA